MFIFSCFSPILTHIHNSHVYLSPSWREKFLCIFSLCICGHGAEIFRGAVWFSERYLLNRLNWRHHTQISLSGWRANSYVFQQTCVWFDDEMWWSEYDGISPVNCSVEWNESNSAERDKFTKDLKDNPTNHASARLLTEQPSNHHGSTLPPVPPPHRQQPSITALNHSLGSALHAGQSLNSTRQLTPPTGSPAPVAGQSPAELQTTPPESVPLQDSWVLGSNVPLETR